MRDLADLRVDRSGLVHPHPGHLPQLLDAEVWQERQSEILIPGAGMLEGRKPANPEGALL